MQTTVLIMLAVIVPCCLLSTRNPVKKCKQVRFNEFKEKYGKVYDTPEEERRRYKIFKRSLMFVTKHNRRFDAGEVSFTVAINELSDLTQDEIRATRKGYKPPPEQCRSSSTSSSSSSSEDQQHWRRKRHAQPLPASFDWRDFGAVSDVRDQSPCASCYAFVASSALESHGFLRTGEMWSLAPQNLVDCAQSDGCKGGSAVTSFDYVAANRGINTEADYPYTAAAGKCRYNAARPAMTCAGTGRVEPSEDALQTALVTIGPIAVAVDSDHASFHHYRSGVFYEPRCRSDFADHAMLAVGYGTERNTSTGDSIDFWIVKNSWGTDWGEDGYIRIRRNADNHCGVAREGAYPKMDGPFDGGHNGGSEVHGSPRFEEEAEDPAYGEEEEKEEEYPGDLDGEEGEDEEEEEEEYPGDDDTIPDEEDEANAGEEYNEDY